MNNKIFENLELEIKNMIKVVNDDFNNEEYEVVKTYGQREAYKKACYTILGIINELEEKNISEGV